MRALMRCLCHPRPPRSATRGSVSTAIPGATKPLYSVVHADLGSTLSVVVDVRLPDGKVQVASATVRGGPVAGAAAGGAASAAPFAALDVRPTAVADARAAMLAAQPVPVLAQGSKWCGAHTSHARTRRA
jgi:hypothetical protein